MKPGLALASLTAAVAALVAHPAAAQSRPPSASASAQDGPNHAAVVVDTGDGVVRKMCLAFSEAELSGIEALRRVGTRPNRFETFSGKGSGVCMLCGVGCPSGDCFCDPDEFWAYHRAGPGETSYRTSSLGASSTVVRDGDVEAWRWGTGSAPDKASVSEVCDVPEPPARTTSSTTTSPPSGGTTTTAEPTATTTPPASGGTAPPASSLAGTRPGSTGTPTTRPLASPGGLTPDAGTGPDPDPAAVAGSESAGVGAAATEANAARGEGRPPTSTGGRTSDGTDVGQIAGLAAFTALVGGLLGWRARLRRAKRRGVRPVR